MTTVQQPAAHVASPAPTGARFGRGDSETETLQRRAEAGERAADEIRAAAAEAGAQHERALREDRRRSAAAIAAAEEVLQTQAAELVAQHHTALDQERARSAAAVEAAVAPLRGRLTADAAAHDKALRAEREKVAEAVEAATAPLRHRVGALHEASTRAAALVRTLQQPSGSATAGGHPAPYPYEGNAPLWVAAKVTDFCRRAYRRAYDAALSLSREQRLAAGMVGCLALQLLLIWLIRRYLEAPPEVCTVSPVHPSPSPLIALDPWEGM